MYNCKIIDKKEILRARSFCNTGIYCSSDGVGTVYSKYSKIPPSTSMHFATRVKTWRVVCLSATGEHHTKNESKKFFKRIQEVTQEFKPSINVCRNEDG